MKILCPSCGKHIELGPAPRKGERFVCMSCAGMEFTWTGGRLTAIPKASCPVCENVVELPEGVKPLDRFPHCGKTFVVTLEFGSYALEDIPHA